MILLSSRSVNSSVRIWVVPKRLNNFYSPVVESREIWRVNLLTAPTNHPRNFLLEIQKEKNEFIYLVFSVCYTTEKIPRKFSKLRSNFQLIKMFIWDAYCFILAIFSHQNYVYYRNIIFTKVIDMTIEIQFEFTFMREKSG